MNNSTLVEAYFDQPNNKNLNSLITAGFSSIDTLATMLSNMREPLSPQLCEAIGQHIKEVSMLTFLAYEKAVKH